MTLEIAMPLSSVDQSNFWPIRRNLLINCSGALALLVTVVVAGLGFRSYAHGKYLEKQLEIAGQLQSELLPRKAGHATVYALAEVVGQAILDDLKHGRPKTGDRHLFFRIYAPQAPTTAAAVSSSVALYLHKAGIQVRRAGSHTLRHTCVQRLIDAEFPVKTIGDYVGHRSPQSTRIYGKIAIASLTE